MEKDKSVLFYEYEPFVIQTSIGSYRPDFLINNRKIIEVKPGKALKRKENIVKIKEAKKYAQNNGLKLEVWSENELFN